MHFWRKKLGCDNLSGRYPAALTWMKSFFIFWFVNKVAWTMIDSQTRKENNKLQLFIEISLLVGTFFNPR